MKNTASNISDKITVVVACYNVEQFVDKCVHSIVNSLYSNLEIILIDDGSVDKTPEILNGWAGKDNRIILIHQTNMGLSEVRNVGLAKATGKYICFIDGDDYIDSDFVGQLYKSLTENSADFSMCSTRMYRCDKLHGILNPRLTTITDNLEKKLDTLRGGGVCDKLFSVSFLKNNNIFFEKDRVYEGNLFLLKCCFFSSYFAFVPNTFYNYCIRADSITTTSNTDKIERAKSDRIYFLKKMIEFSKDKGFSKSEKKALLRFIGRSLLDIDNISFFYLLKFLHVNGLINAKGKKYFVKSLLHMFVRKKSSS